MEASLSPPTSESREITLSEKEDVDPKTNLDDNGSTPSEVLNVPTQVIHADFSAVATSTMSNPEGSSAIVEDPSTETIATPPVESVPSNVTPTVVATQLASTSSTNKQLQPQDQQQQNVNMANDWDASDIEKKLSENSSLLTQWSLVLDKNGNYVALLMLVMISLAISLFVLFASIKIVSLV